MNVCSFKLTGSTASGSLSKNTPAFTQSLLMFLAIIPATNTTEYALTVTDNNSVDIISQDCRGAVRLSNLGIPVSGILTIAITSATADESFTEEISVVENYR